MYSVEYLAIVRKKDIPNVSLRAKARLKKAIETRLMTDPVRFGKPLRYSLQGHRRLRVGNYRVVYRIEEKHKKVLIVAIKHRRDVYKNF